MKRIQILLIAALICLALSACAYRHYMGLHGPTIRAHPDIHSGFTQDAECLGCHGEGDESQGPPTSHPQFKGCLKCHNDDLRAAEKK